MTNVILKKLVYLLLIVSFYSCTSTNGSDGPNSVVEKKIIYNWKISFSKTESAGELPYLPYGISVHPNGEIYVSDRNTDQLLVFDSNGELKKTIGTKGSETGQFKDIGPIVIDGLQRLLISDSSNNRVQILNTLEGTFSTVYKIQDFQNPMGVAVDIADNVYIVDSLRMHLYSVSGEFITDFRIDLKNNQQNENFYDIAVNSLGNIYITDKMNHRVIKFDSEGEYISDIGSIGIENGKFKYPSSIAIDEDDNIYVSELGNHRIQIFDKKGDFIYSFGKYGNEKGEFNGPIAITLDKNKNIYVADTNNHRIQIFELNISDED